ncbi:MAG TPA: ABC-F family ATP-binding cassette domain-containing protein [Candidatus Oscillibacter excrementigallinarum]|uniref:ABC-F family ATP-binding cassette domain-containing protein n=1 Tax=Candidatus Oscillibacter excrementigallinarum TaxID=2838716 RepID=A0A9D2RSI8_9FIRM|nr:ABC-F family ATP-binding cassette domain-containing protein [Candidatus Oscillibacter excrementigallinarum]
MIEIQVNDLVKSFEVGKNVLDGLTFQVDQGERVGLLGRNGAGKTTLFKILTGELDYDEGTVVVGQGRRVGLISQIPVYPAGYTVEDVLRSAFARLQSLAEEMRALEARMAAGESDPAILKRYGTLSERFEAFGGYDTDVAVNKIANGLSIPDSQRQQLFDSLSGGEKTRVNLGRLILEDTDILLLDEPTNHLDLHATEWLEEYIRGFRGTVVTISHDRYFLDRTVTRVIEIQDGRAEFYSGNYSFYAVEKERRYQERMKQYEKEQAKIAQLEKAAEQLRVWAFMGMDKTYRRAISMEKRIERMRTTSKPTKARKMDARFSSAEFHGDEVLGIRNVSKSYGDKKLFENISLRVEGGERIALIGDNGTGKSTLIKMIVGELYPDDGRIKTGPQVKEAYLPQIVRFDHPDWNLVENMMAAKKGLSAQSARNRLAAYDFRGEDVFKPVSVLSGGEQSRLRLCMLMDDEINFLILDEPTNHLDIDSREWIEEAVEAYDGTLLFVSHDRYFINRFATRIWELADGTITDYPCGFAQYRQMKAQEAAEKAAAPKPEKEREKPAVERPQRGNKAQQAARRQLTICERDIAKAEEHIAALEADMEAAACDYEKLNELVGQKDAAQAELDALYERWEQLSEEAEG